MAFASTLMGVLVSKVKNFIKVFEVPRNFFQKVSLWGLGQRPKETAFLLYYFSLRLRD
jgi:hypothetical protein